MGDQTEPKTVTKKSKKSSNKQMAVPYACVKRLSSEMSGGMRISSDAVYIVEKSMEQFIKKLVTISKSYTEHRGRKTLTAKDIEAALENMKEL